MKLRKKHDPIVPGKILTLSNGKQVASPARKSFLKERGFTTPVHEATVAAFTPPQSSVASEPIRNQNPGAYGNCQAKAKSLPSNLRKLFRRVSAQVEDKFDQFEQV